MDTNAPTSNFDDFDYGDDDEDPNSKNNKPKSGQELPAALANLLDTLKQSSPSVSHNSVPDNISHSTVPLSHDKPITLDNVQNSVYLPSDANRPLPPYQGEPTWNQPFQAPSQPYGSEASPPPAAAMLDAYRPPHQAPVRPPNPNMIHGALNPQVSLLDHPAKVKASQPTQEPGYKPFGNSIVFDDPALPEGSIRGSYKHLITFFFFTGMP
jgi:hypothetical protein